MDPGPAGGIVGGTNGDTLGFSLGWVPGLVGLSGVGSECFSLGDAQCCSGSAAAAAAAAKAYLLRHTPPALAGPCA